MNSPTPRPRSFSIPPSGVWATELFKQFDVPTRMLGSIVQPGTCLGKVTPAVAAETGLADVDVILPGTHDYGQCRDGSARGGRTPGETQLVLHQFGNLVADGGGDDPSGSSTMLAAD